MYTENEIRELINKALSNTVTRNTPIELYEPILYSISVGGKRIRPTLCLLCYNLFKQTIDNNVIMPAIGIEVFHGFTLIHDDIMDNADVRRNHATVHKKWSDNTAILSGDAMCIESYRLIAQTDKNYLLPILEVFSKTAAQVCEGQQFDMIFEKKSLITETDYLTMIGLKTAALIAASAKIGAIVADASAVDCENLYMFGYNLGMAFQIQDDVLDIYGNPAVFGKTIGGDIASNKKTFLLVSALQKTQGEKFERLEALLKDGKLPNDKKFNEIKTIFDECGVKQIAETKVNEYFDNAIKYLEKIKIAQQRKENIIKFINELINRNY